MQKVTGGRDQLGAFAPQFAELNDDVLFGQVWAREDELDPKHRSMLTISGLMGAGILDSSFEAHLAIGKANGITQREITAMITQLAFYTGWPKAWATFLMAMKVYDAEADSTEEAGNAGGNGREVIEATGFPIGRPNDAYAKYFTDQSHLAPLNTEEQFVAHVCFEPGCRNHWHRHRTAQILMITAGRGWVQREGENAVEVTAGDVIYTPAGTRHWHGATKDSWFSHIAFQVPGEDMTTDWFEPVTDEYTKLN